MGVRMAYKPTCKWGAPSCWYMEVSCTHGYPNSWMVDFIESPNLEWMRTGGKTNFRKVPYISTPYIYIIYILWYVNQYIWCAIYIYHNGTYPWFNFHIHVHNIYIYTIYIITACFELLLSGLWVNHNLLPFLGPFMGRIWEHTEDNRHMFDDRWTNLTIWNSVIKANNVCFYCHKWEEHP